MTNFAGGSLLRPRSRRFSFLMPDRRIIIEAASVEAACTAPDHPAALGAEAEAADVPLAAPAPGERPDVHEYAQLFAAGEWSAVPLYRRAALAPGQAVDGPRPRRSPRSPRLRARSPWPTSLAACPFASRPQHPGHQNLLRRSGPAGPGTH